MLFVSTCGPSSKFLEVLSLSREVGDSASLQPVGQKQGGVVRDDELAVAVCVASSVVSAPKKLLADVCDE